jgi:hypothetical protein
MGNKQAPVDGGPASLQNSIEEYARPACDATSICAAVAVALVLEELDRLKALELLPTPAALLERLRARTGDFGLLAGVAGAYLHEQGIASAHGVR